MYHESQLLQTQIIMNQPTCKICQQPVAPAHTVDEITYYRCPKCLFLQNHYWDEEHPKADHQTEVNNDWLQKHWLPAEADHDYAKGWEMLQLMAWPPTWYVRQLNDRLLQLPNYEQIMRRHVKKKLTRIMDFGCGYGTVLLELARRDNFDVLGVDPYTPNPSEHILKQDLLKTDLPPASFDAIFSIETLEHIPNPLAIFKRLHQLLKPGGTLLVQTRRQEDPDYIEQQDQWFYLKEPTIHVSVYSIPTMQVIAKKTGWKHVQFKGAKYARFQK